ncbi:MAG: FAD-dependent oxidoreductase, partial [Candidatus Omnitrophica bacterium]|nr:FAD-dependent oxidoreductase [Candidatus Omnitrophota bacterium]
NKAWKTYCAERDITVNACGKLVVANDEEEREKLHELKRRGERNGSNVRICSAEEAKAIEPNVKTYKEALYSPDTASVDPAEVCRHLRVDLEKQGVVFQFNTRYVGRKGNIVLTDQGDLQAGKIINCAGLYADKVAKDFGFGERYTMIPFKGLYLKYTKNKTDIKINIYPVPNLNNPFLGVHFTKTADGSIKIGPTAIPALWRENYTGMDNFKIDELASIFWQESRLFLTNAFHFRDLAYEEWRKYNKRYFIQLAQNMVEEIDPEGFTEFTKPGIRAQLLDKTRLALLQDFVVEADQNSIHVLNAVSPAFTCAFPFARYVVSNYC